MSRSLFLLLCLIGFLPAAQAQDTYLPLGDNTYHLLTRLETKSGYFSNDLFLTDKAVSRRDIYRFLSQYKSGGYYSGKTTVDNFNIFQTLSKTGEWAFPGGDGAEVSQYSLGPFYRRKPDFFYLNKPGFFWVINPVLGASVTSQIKPEQKVLRSFTEGITTRGRIGKWLGFSFLLTNNNSQPVRFERQYFQQWNAIPGNGSFKKSGENYQYLLFRGNLDVPLIRNHISLNMGYGQHFIGDGIRSLFLSDNAPPAFYVGFRTKIWHLEYQNLYLRLHPNQLPGQKKEGGYKYATLHFLSVNLRPWLNVGFFETVVFSRNGAYEIAYMNPIIFYRAVERALGSPDKVSVGFNTKAIVLKRFDFYGQFLLNEFSGKNFFSHDGYWANKWGLQLGLKYFDVFSIPNLDMQAEVNMVRPYTYSHRDLANGLAIESFSSGNLPLAHPLGADFQEFIAAVNYQPVPKLSVNGQLMLYRQSVDTGGYNFGNNIFKGYNTGNKKDYGNHFVNGPEAKCLMAKLEVSYEWKPELYFFIGGAYRKYNAEKNIRPEATDLYINAGFRLNLSGRDKNWY